MQQEQNKSAKDTTMSGKRMRNITRGYHEKDGRGGARHDDDDRTITHG